MADTMTLSDSFVAELEGSAASIVVHLSKAPIDPTGDGQSLAAIVEADYIGYEPIPLHFEPCDVPEDEYAELASDEVIFTTGGFDAVQVIYFAYAVYSGPGGNPRLLGIYEFPEPIRIMSANQEISTGAWRITRFE